MTLLAQNANAVLNARIDAVAEYIIESIEIQTRATTSTDDNYCEDVLSDQFLAHRIYFALRVRFDIKTTLMFIKEYYSECYDAIKNMSDLIEVLQ
jgi:hypothetical protein